MKSEREKLLALIFFQTMALTPKLHEINHVWVVDSLVSLPLQLSVGVDCLVSLPIQLSVQVDSLGSLPIQLSV